MSISFKDADQVKKTISDIRTKQLPHHYQKPLVAIVDDADRNATIDKIISKVFGAENHNPNINTKKELQDALEKAVIEVSRETDSKFNRPVGGVAANYLGRWLGTNINVEYSRGGEKELNDMGASVIAAKEILNKTLAPTEPEAEQKNTNSSVSTNETQPSNSNSVKDYGKVLSNSHEVTESAFESLKNKLTPINKRLTKNNLAPIELKVSSERFTRSKKTESLVKLIKFDIEIPPMVLPGGWKFVARVDHEAAGNIIVSVPNSGHERDLHSMYGNSQPSYCDHCRTTRARTSTFIVENDKGELKRIGRQCLKGYLPGGEAAVKGIVNMAQYLTDLALELIEVESKDYDDQGGGEGGFGGIPKYEGANFLMSVGLYIVDKYGFVSRSRASAAYETGDDTQVSTVDRAVQLLYDRSEQAQAEREVYAEKKEAYEKQAEDVINWGIDYVEEQLKAKGPSDYMNNLRVILKGAKEQGAVANKHIGYFLSIIPFYKKAKEQQAAPKEATKESNYVGTEGYPIGDLNPNDRRKMKKAGVGSEGFPYNGPILTTVKSARGFERQGFGYYDRGGTGTVLSLVDDQGNVYVTFLSYSSDSKPGDKMLIKRALVKSHKDYTDKAGKTTKQTTLTRVDFGTYDEVERLGSTQNESVSFEEYYTNKK